MLTSAQIRSLLEAYGVDSSTDLADKIGAYVELLLKWNRKISLTSVTDPIEIVKFHFGESLFAVSTVSCGKSRLADVGTGAGFPGLPLALAVANLEVELIESNLKKGAFLAEVIRELSISNAIVFRGRMESLKAKGAGFDFITARALGRFDELLDWSAQSLRSGGSLLLWLGQHDSAEVSSRPDWEWNRPVLIPGSKGRYTLRGWPNRLAL